MNVGEKLISIGKTIPANVKLVAVSKTKPNQMVWDAYNAGQRIFGENKAQDLANKYPELPHDIRWHFIGHLQTNKVKFIAPFVSMVESVDSLKILHEIDKQAQKAGRIIPCLLQFHIAEEETKFGLDIEEAKGILETEDFGKMKNITLAGVMGMATYTDDYDQVRREFRVLRNIYRQLKITFFSNHPDFKEISMGMSGETKGLWLCYHGRVVKWSPVVVNRLRFVVKKCN